MNQLIMIHKDLLVILIIINQKILMDLNKEEILYLEDVYMEKIMNKMF